MLPTFKELFLMVEKCMQMSGNMSEIEEDECEEIFVISKKKGEEK